MLERSTRDNPTFAALADNPAGGGLRIVKEEFVKARGAGHLAYRPARDARLIEIDQQIRNALVLGRLGFGAHQREHVRSIAALRGPGFLAIDDPMITLQACTRTNRSEVRTRSGLRIA